MSRNFSKVSAPAGTDPDIVLMPLLGVLRPCKGYRGLVGGTEALSIGGLVGASGCRSRSARLQEARVLKQRQVKRSRSGKA